MGNYYNLLDTLKNHFDNDAFINTVTEGDIFAVDLSKQTIFPLAHIIVNSSSIENNVIRFNVSILCMDIVDISKNENTNVFIGDNNEQDVLNTQLAVLNRLVMELRKGTIHTSQYQLSGDANCEPFFERFENKLAGWTATFDVDVANDITIC